MLPAAPKGGSSHQQGSGNMSSLSDTLGLETGHATAMRARAAAKRGGRQPMPGAADYSDDSDLDDSDDDGVGIGGARGGGTPEQAPKQAVKRRRPLPVAGVTSKGGAFRMMLDTGAEISLISAAALQRLPASAWQEVHDAEPIRVDLANGSSYLTTRQVRLTVLLGPGGPPMTVSAYVQDQVPADVLLGRDCLGPHRVAIDHDSASMPYEMAAGSRRFRVVPRSA